MLRTIRIILALLSFTAITLLFVDFTGYAGAHWGWLAKWQFVPALLSLNIVVLAAIIAATFLFGRVYCSVLCPLGVFQDIVSRLRIIFTPRRKRRIGVFRYHRAADVVRRSILVCFVVLIILALTNLVAAVFASLIEPYAMYGRIASGLEIPLVLWLNNILADYATAHGSFAFYHVYEATSMLVTVVGAVTFVLITVSAALGGRWYCNTVCPVGTTLGFASRHALMKPVINLDACNGCRSCERHCKASCIDAKNHYIDLSRCVACMDCIGQCSQNAISFGIRPRHGKPSPGSVKPAPTAPAENGIEPITPDSQGRRNFMIGLGVVAGAAVAHASHSLNDGALTPVTARNPVRRHSRVVPAGAVSYAHLNQHCVGCQLCIRNCPNGVLRASTDPETFMQPVLDYTEGYCPPECNVCSQICPAGAFHPVDEAAKAAIKVGTAVVDSDICIAATQGVDCGNCERHCPVGAITMYWVTDDEDDTRSIPVINENACIGCGACEAHCPAGHVESTRTDRAAIHVEGVSVHREI